MICSVDARNEWLCGAIRIAIIVFSRRIAGSNGKRILASLEITYCIMRISLLSLLTDRKSNAGPLCGRWQRQQILRYWAVVFPSAHNFFKTDANQNA